MAIDITDRARRWFTQVWPTHDRALAAAWLAADVRGESAGRVIEGREAWLREVFDTFVGAFPDIRFDVLGTLTEGDQVVVRWRMHGSHLGDTLGMPPCGHRVRLDGITWLRFVDGQIAQGQDGFDVGSLMQALASGSSCAGVTLEASI